MESEIGGRKRKDTNMLVRDYVARQVNMKENGINLENGKLLKMQDGVRK